MAAERGWPTSPRTGRARSRIRGSRDPVAAVALERRRAVTAAHVARLLHVLDRRARHGIVASHDPVAAIALKRVGAKAIALAASVRGRTASSAPRSRLTAERAQYLLRVVDAIRLVALAAALESILERDGRGRDVSRCLELRKTITGEVRQLVPDEVELRL